MNNTTTQSTAIKVSLDPKHMEMVWDGACRNGVPTSDSVMQSMQALIFLMTGLGADFVVVSKARFDGYERDAALLKSIRSESEESRLVDCQPSGS